MRACMAYVCMHVPQVHTLPTAPHPPSPPPCTTTLLSMLQVEYINLRGTSKENPAVCKYTGNKYYSDPHTWLAH